MDTCVEGTILFFSVEVEDQAVFGLSWIRGYHESSLLDGFLLICDRSIIKRCRSRHFDPAILGQARWFSIRNVVRVVVLDPSSKTARPVYLSFTKIKMT
jgi:hypothetical protein